MDFLTEQIKKQYMKFPYPAIPIGHMEDETLCSTEYEFINYHLTGKYKTSENIEILDAGCGTGYSTLKLAQRNPKAKITAVDISSESIQIAKKRIEKSNIDQSNIEFIEMNLLDTSSINKKFDYIVSTGVLHHLSSPQKGLENLKTLLKEDGFMYLMFYSKYGRMFLEMGRSVIKTLMTDKNNIDEGINIGKKFLNVLPKDHHIILSDTISNENSNKIFGEDFTNSDSQFVDCYINANETTYKIEELFELLRDCNLEFLSFYDEVLYNPQIMFKNDPLLLEKSKKLSKLELYKIGEIVNMRNNFSFFASHKQINRKIYTNDEIKKSTIILSKLNKVEENENGIRVFSPIGTGLNFAPNIIFLYKYFFEQDNQSFQVLCKNIQKDLNFSRDEIETLIITFLRNMDKENLIYFT